MKYLDRVKQTSTDTGTGNLALGSSLPGYRAFPEVFTSTDRFMYVVEEPVSGQWELGVGQCLGSTLVRETPLHGSATVPVSFASGTKNVFVVHPAVLSQAEHMRVFGTGADGDAVITGTVTLLQNTDYRNLTISGAGQLITRACRVRVSGVLDLSNATTAGAINANGDAGSTGSASGPAGSGGSVTSASTTGRAQAGVSGGAGGTAAGATSAPPADLITVSNGGNGGSVGGAGGAGSGGAGGAASGSGVFVNTPVRFGIEPLIRWDNSTNAAIFIRGGAGGCGGGGGGGDGTAGGGGGGGGSGGGVLDLAAAVLKVGSLTSVDAISAIGGGAGFGGSPAAGNRGGGGGGAGGGGGYVHLVIGTLLGSKAGVLSARGGVGGNGGVKTGSGVNGTGGHGGNGGTIHVIKAATGTFTEVLGSAGSASSGSSGGGGGASGGDL